MGRLHDRTPARPRPRDRLGPRGDGALEGRKARPAASQICVEDRDEVEPPGAEIAHVVRAAHEHLTVVRQPWCIVGTETAHGHGRHAAGPFLHALGPPATQPEVARAARAASARRTAHDASNLPIARTQGAAALRTSRRTTARATDRRDPVSGQRRVHERPARGGQGAHEPRGATLGAGRHDLHGHPAPPARPHRGQRPRGGLRRRRHSGEHDRRPVDVPTRQGDVANVIVRSPILPVRRMGLAAHDDEAELRHGREDRGTRADHHVVASGLHVEPGPDPRSLRTPQQGRHAIAERPGDRRRRRRHGRCLGHDHQSAAPGVEAGPDRFHRRRRLMFGRRPQHPRPGVAALDGCEHVGSLTVVAEHLLETPRRGDRSPVGHAVERLLTGDPRRRGPLEHRCERRNVSLADPSAQIEHPLVEPPHRRYERAHGQDAMRQVVGRAEHPSTHRAPVEGHLYERAEPGSDRTRQVVGERAVEAQERPGDADRDGPGERPRMLS